jgi:hypothetical protein
MITPETTTSITSNRPKNAKPMKDADGAYTFTTEELAEHDRTLVEAVEARIEKEYGHAPPSTLERYGFEKKDVGSAVKTVAAQVFSAAVVVGTVAGACYVAHEVFFGDEDSEVDDLEDDGLEAL